MNRPLAALIVIMALLSSCADRKSPGHDRGNALSLRHARLITIAESDDAMTATIADPWQSGRTLQTISVGRGGDGHSLATFKRVIVFSTSHCYLLDCLGLSDRIVGVCDAKYIFVPAIRQRLRDGRIKDCGDSMSPDIERIISLNPDAIILSPFEGSGGFGKLEKLGIPLVQAADYMETSTLGRAEWMRFYGRLFGEGRRADSLYHVVDSTYQSLRTFAATLPPGKSILTERKTGATWYTPGGSSSLGMIIKDARGRYAFGDDTHGGSLALSYEQIIDKAGESDIWAFKYNGSRPMTREDLLREFHGYSALKAFRTGQIYECNTTVKPYFEETPFRPDYLLREMIQLLHPDAKVSPLRYYRRLDQQDGRKK